MASNPFDSLQAQSSADLFIGRAPRARRDRPCDACRRNKNRCCIPVRTEPCLLCQGKRIACTFNNAPGHRKRAAQARENMSAGSDATIGKGIQAERAASMLAGGLVTSSPAISLSFDTEDPIWGTMASEYSLSDADLPIQHPPSLDLATDAVSESHFLGPEAFSALVLDVFQDQGEGDHPGPLHFRQVSTDDKHPAFFIRHQALLYGRAANSVQEAFAATGRLCESVDRGLLSRCVNIMMRNTFPAMPVVNGKRLEVACLGQADSGPIPYGLLSWTVATSLVYMRHLKHLQPEMVRNAYQGMEDDFRHPRLMTLQSAAIALSGRPNNNVGQRGILAARAIGAAYLLGLHVDPTDWKLPLWERNVRKRLWWALVIHDKWIALLYGRPSIIHHDGWNVTLPSVSDSDWSIHISVRDKHSFMSFIFTCKLTLIVDRLLTTVCSVRASSHETSALSRLALLDSVSDDLTSLEKELPAELRLPANGLPGDPNPATGIRSMQLSLLGMRVIIQRLTLDTVLTKSVWQVSASMHAATATCNSLVEFIHQVSKSDLEVFWMPYSSLHLANCAQLLIRIGFRSQTDDTVLSQTATFATERLIDWLITAVTESDWDVAEGALLRISPPLLTASLHMLSMRPIYAKMAAVLHLAVPDYPQTHDNAQNTNGDPVFQWAEGNDAWMEPETINNLLVELFGTQSQDTFPVNF